MPTVRKYSNIHVCPHGDHGRVAYACTCDPGEGEFVTAIDQRDVEPLVGAAKELLENGTAYERDLLEAALAPFLDNGGESDA